VGGEYAGIVTVGVVSGDVVEVRQIMGRGIRGENKQTVTQGRGGGNGGGGRGGIDCHHRDPTAGFAKAETDGKKWCAGKEKKQWPAVGISGYQHARRHREQVQD